MKLRQFKTLSNDIFTVAIHTEDWSEADRQLMERFGEPEINVGGEDTVCDPTYTLPDELVKIMSESPFVQSFDARDDEDAGDAEAKANCWATATSDKISAAVTTMRNQTDTFTGESVTTI